jgi:hypothetical protein
MRFSISYMCHLTLIVIAFSTQARAQDHVIFHDHNMTVSENANGGNCMGCVWLQLDGEIPSTAGQTFQREFAKGGGEERICFNSPGGSVLGGLELGRAIRKLGFRTAVCTSVPDSAGYQITAQGRCLSACVYAFLGGSTRSAGSGALGIHRFYDSRGLSSSSKPQFSSDDPRCGSRINFDDS